AVGLVAWVAGRRLVSLDPAPPLPPVQAARTVGRWGALAAALLCGFIGIGVEIAGFRLLVFFLEGFTVTFAGMLAVFIAGLGVSSLVLGPRVTRSTRPARVLGVLVLLAGATLLLAWAVVVPRMEPLMDGIKAWAYGDVRSADAVGGALRASTLAGAAVLLLLPAFWLGATFPLCVRWAELSGHAPAQAVGRVYLWNSLGALLAPVLVGFVLLPLRGVAGAWTGLGFIALFGGAALVLHRPGTARSPARLGLTGGGGLVLGLLAAFTLGPGEEELVGASHVLRGRPGRSLQAIETDAITTASVVKTEDHELILYTDDFAAAATGRHYRYMRMLGHLPMLLAERPANVMVIAFGTGTTAGAVAAHPGLERLEVVEVSSAVLDLAQWFERDNRGVLGRSGVEVVRDDGRNALLLHEADLDVITLEPLMPYTPQGLPFYTREFYELARDRLRSGGVLCQWVPVHAMPAGLFAALVRTFFEVFPDGHLWFFEQSTALIGPKGPATVDLATLDDRFSRIADDMEAAGLGSLELLLSAHVASGRAVLRTPPPPSRWTGRSVTDFDPFPEFHPTPRAPLNTSYLEETLAYLALLTAPADATPLAEAVPAAQRLRDGQRRALAARARHAEARRLQVAWQALPKGDARREALAAGILEVFRQATGLYEQALQLLPGDGALLWRRAQADRAAARLEVASLLALAARAAANGEAAQAAEHLALAARRAGLAARLEDGDALASERAPAMLLHAAVLLRMGRCREAAAALSDTDVGGALPPESADAQLVEDARAFVERHAGGDALPVPDALSPWFALLPPCRKEGTAPVAGELARFREALEEGRDGRALRIAASVLGDAARREGVVDAVLRELRGGEAPLPPRSRAIWAGLLLDLDPADETLRNLLTSDITRDCVEAVSEAGRRRLLRNEPALAAALASHEDPGVRTALADAAGADGTDPLLCLVATLLVDPVRTVRLAAVTAIARH
ncbi:MAG: spermine/spermidine synthase domain-containing protein, partial [Planctomycetota bacterium]